MMMMMMRNQPQALRSVALAVISVALSGCASLSPDGGFGPAAQRAQAATGQAASYQRSEAQVQAVQARVAELLSSPLSADSAVALALLNQRGLQAQLQTLGLAEAEMLRASRPPNPSLHLGQMRGGGHSEIERGLNVDLLGWLTLPWTKPLQDHHWQQAQLEAVQALLHTATEARLAYYAALGAKEQLSYFEQVKHAADATHELAQRMRKAGNFSRLEQLREQAFQAEALAGLNRAQAQATTERERLARALGVADADLLKLPPRLPDLPALRSPSPGDLQTALAQRLDVQAAKQQAEAQAKALGLSRATGFINVLNLGYQRKNAKGEDLQQGPSLELELPLFDFGQSRQTDAQARYMQALHQAADVGVRARSELRERLAAQQSAHALALHYRQEVVPLRKRIADENLLRYNGMLIGVFELLADTREQIHSVADSVQALRDYWIADTQLQAALHGPQP